jgi:hypothetical protein
MSVDPPSAETGGGGRAYLTAEREELLARVFTAGLAVVAGAWALSSLWLPYGWDQGAFGYLSDTVLRGGMPYRDALDIKGPLTFYIFAGLQLAFGRQMWAIRAFDLVLLACASFAGVRLASKFVSRRAAVNTMLALVITFGSFGNWYTAQPDGWAACGILVVVYLLAAPGPASARNAALSGAILGACCLFKPLYLMYMTLVACAAWPPRGSGKDGIRRALMAGSAGLAGFVAPIAIAVAWFAAHGALGPMLDIYVRYNMERSSEASGLLPFSKVVQVAIGLPTSLPVLAVAVPAATLGAVFVVREDRRQGLLLLLWAFVSLAAIAAQRKFFAHNYSWHPFFQAVGFLAGIGLARAWNGRDIDRVAGRWLFAVTAFATLKLVSHEPLVEIGRWAKVVTGRMTLAQYQRTYDDNLFYGPASSFGFSVPRDVEIAAYLDQHTRPSDEILVWSDPLVNYLSDRRAITPITIAHAFTVWGTEARRKGYRDALVEQMKGPDAAYFGIAERDLFPMDDEQNVPTQVPEVLDVLRDEYVPDDIVGDVHLFKRRGR